MDFRVLQGVSRAALADRAHREEQDRLASEQRLKDRSAFETYLGTVANHPQMPDPAKYTALQALLATAMKGDKVDDKHYQHWSDQLWRSTSRPAPFTQDERNLQTAAQGPASVPMDSPIGGGDVFGEAVRGAAAHIPVGSDRPQISGLLGPEEIARGRAAAFKTEMDALGGMGGVGGSGNNTTILPRMDSKGGMSFTTRSTTPQQKNYFVGGQPVFGVFDPASQRIHDRSGNDITEHVDSIAGPNGTRWVVAAGDDGSPQFEAMSRIAAPGTVGPKAPVRLNLSPTETSTGAIGSLPVNPYSGAVAGKNIPRGQKTNADVHRDSVVTGTIAKKIATKATLDPTAFPETPTPAGLPTLTDENGQPVTVGTKVFTATREPGSVLQRASTARSVVAQGDDVTKKILDPKNSDLFGKVKGRINQLFVRGPHGVVGLRWVGPIGTDDPRLSDIYAGLKSVSDLLTTVHGRRSEQSAQDFFDTMQLVNSPEALAAAVQQYVHVARQIAGEGQRPTTPVNLHPARVPVGSTDSSSVGDSSDASPGTSSDPTLDALRELAAKIEARPATAPAPAAAPAASATTQVPSQARTQAGTPIPVRTPVRAPATVPAKPTPTTTSPNPAQTPTKRAPAPATSTGLQPARLDIPSTKPRSPEPAQPRSSSQSSAVVRWDPSYIRQANNNPTNIKYGALTRKWVDDGLATLDPVKAGDGGHYIRFNTVSDGLQAAQALLLSSGYKNLSVNEALRRWSDGAYDTIHLNLSGIGNKKVSALSRNEMSSLLGKMAHYESGYRELRSTGSAGSSTSVAAK